MLRFGGRVGITWLLTSYAISGRRKRIEAFIALVAAIRDQRKISFVLP
jgi:hypothetical protein